MNASVVFPQLPGRGAAGPPPAAAPTVPAAPALIGSPARTAPDRATVRRQRVSIAAALVTLALLVLAVNLLTAQLKNDRDVVPAVPAAAAAVVVVDASPPAPPEQEAP
jgi:peptidoglycan/LPS O-acetylase OafA/YrhL